MSLFFPANKICQRIRPAGIFRRSFRAQKNLRRIQLSAAAQGSKSKTAEKAIKLILFLASVYTMPALHADFLPSCSHNETVATCCCCVSCARQFSAVRRRSTRQTVPDGTEWHDGARAAGR